eukprot:1158711-Pelagomonas_calceolata.AAC.11
MRGRCRGQRQAYHISRACVECGMAAGTAYGEKAAGPEYGEIAAGKASCWRQGGTRGRGQLNTDNNQSTTTKFCHAHLAHACIIGSTAARCSRWWSKAGVQGRAGGIGQRCTQQLKSDLHVTRKNIIRAQQEHLALWFFGGQQRTQQLKSDLHVPRNNVIRAQQEHLALWFVSFFCLVDDSAIQISSPYVPHKEAIRV